MNKPEHYVRKHAPITKHINPSPSFLRAMDEYADDFTVEFLRWCLRTNLKGTSKELILKFRQENGLFDKTNPSGGGYLGPELMGK